MSDLRLPLRGLAQRPLFAAVTVLSLAVGLGASTLVFSVVNALLLRPPSGIADVDRVVEIGRTVGGRGFDTFSYPELIALQERGGPFEQVAGWMTRPLSLRAGDAGVRVEALLASHNYFDALDVRPYLGRFIAAEEDRVGAQSAVAVVSYAFWRDRLASDVQAIGREIELNRRDFTVIGVLPEAFRGHSVMVVPDVLIPITSMSVVDPGFDSFGELRAEWVLVLARLAPDATIEQAAHAARATIESFAPPGKEPANLRSATSSSWAAYRASAARPWRRSSA